MAESARNLETIETLKRRQGKRYSGAVKSLREKTTEKEFFSIDEAIKLLTELAAPKFDQTAEVAFRLGVDPKQSDQMVRGALVLPNGLGRATKVVVFAKGAKADEAQKAGADEVGADELATKIQGGWTDFTSVVATPDMMPVVSKVARVLGPRGLMPNPKLGTVTMDLEKVIGELKKGRVEFRVDKAGVLQAPFGKLSFGAEKLAENFRVLAEHVMRAKPSTAKGHYMLSVYVSATMSPSVGVETSEITNLI